MRWIVKFLNLSPAFDGVEGWIWITELDVIDPRGKRFATLENDYTATDGTIFVYAYLRRNRP